jgi:hypothetical protein
MKIIIYENPFEHGSRITPDLFKCLAGLEVIALEDFQEVDKLLSEEAIDYIFVHHSRNEEIDFLKRKYSKTKYIAYSGCIGAGWVQKGSNLNSINQSFANELLKRYDKLIYSPYEGLEAITQLEMEKLGK